MKKYLTALFLVATSVLSKGQPADNDPGGVRLPPGYSVEVKKSIDRAQNEAENAYRDAQDRYGNTFLYTPDSSAGPPGPPAGSLIVPKDATDAKALADLEEDLAVMSRILEKAAGPNDKSRSAMGIPVNRKFFGNGPRNIYIEGYGALFFVHVNFPLVPPVAEKTEAPAKPETSNEWEEARRELSSPPANGNTFTYASGNFDLWMATTTGNQEYDAERVDELKQDLVAALKNAAHIRKLKPDELVTVVVTGHNTFTARLPARAIRRTEPRNAPNPPPPAPLPSRETKLIVRARRADIEAFQKDKLSAEDFRKKASVIIY